jgi:hypothetical protein
MKKFVNMDFDGSNWWVEYSENGEYYKNYYGKEEDAYNFYISIIYN